LRSGGKGLPERSPLGRCRRRPPLRRATKKKGAKTGGTLTLLRGTGVVTCWGGKRPGRHLENAKTRGEEIYKKIARKKKTYGEEEDQQQPLRREIS